MDKQPTHASKNITSLAEGNNKDNTFLIQQNNKKKIYKIKIILFIFLENKLIITNI